MSNVLVESPPIEETDVVNHIRVIDTDSHVLEPPDLWTSRLASKWRDDAPQVAFDEQLGEPRWRTKYRWLTPVGYYAAAGWKEFYPSYPPTLDDVEPGSYDPSARLDRLDELGFWGQVLYPNMIAFDSGAFMELGPDLAEACTMAYNDFLADFAGVNPDRLIPIMMVPFWDIDFALRELERGKANGLKGALFASSFERIGLPPLIEKHWDPIYAAAQDLELSINFHVGFATKQAQDTTTAATNRRNVKVEDFVHYGSLAFASNMKTIAELILYGACERFPRLDFVSVESGFGYIPYLCEALDWQWMNTGGFKQFPNRILPSEYFRRQIYGTFWFEKGTLKMLPDWEDNMMFESDYPHATSLTPGPSSYAALPRTVIQNNIAQLPESTIHKVLHDNAARVYHLD